MEKPFAKKFSTIWVYLARLSSFLEISEYAVQFATGSMFKGDVMVEWKAKIYIKYTYIYVYFVCIYVHIYILSVEIRFKGDMSRYLLYF